MPSKNNAVPRSLAKRLAICVGLSLALSVVLGIATHQGNDIEFKHVLLSFLVFFVVFVVATISYGFVAGKVAGTAYDRLMNVGVREVVETAHHGLMNVGFLKDPSNKTCSQCAESVKGAAKVCRFCGYHFDPQPLSPVVPGQVTTEQPAAQDRSPPCPQCNTKLRYVTESNSWWCGSCQQYFSNQQHTNGNQP